MNRPRREKLCIFREDDMDKDNPGYHGIAFAVVDAHGDGQKILRIAEPFLVHVVRLLEGIHDAVMGIECFYVA